jgi:MFS family permease
VTYAFQTSTRRNVWVLAASLFGLSLGEELWQAYLPAYLTALGAGGVAIGLFGSLKDLLDSLYQYPGGWLADRFGRRRALLTFTAVAIAGYATYALASSWPIVFAGLLGVMAWKAGAFPTTFAVIGDSLPPERRGMAFSVQSILVRLPRVIGAPIGAAAITSLGILSGVRLSLAVTILIALIVFAVQHRGFVDTRREPVTGGAFTGSRTARVPAGLRRLLVADTLVRIGEGLAASFVILFVTQERGFSIAQYGGLFAAQQAIAIASYLPGGRLADSTGRPPIVALTFVFFAAFPLAVRLATTYPALVAAFAIGGLKEIGEPARKSLIVDLAPDDRRASAVGAYYGIRNLAVVPAGVAGGLLWQQAPHLPLEAACVVSTFGLAVFLLTSRRG